MIVKVLYPTRPTDCRGTQTFLMCMHYLISSVGYFMICGGRRGDYWCGVFREGAKGQGCLRMAVIRFKFCHKFKILWRNISFCEIWYTKTLVMIHLMNNICYILLTRKRYFAKFCLFWKYWTVTAKLFFFRHL